MNFAIELFRSVENEGARENYVVAPLSPQILLSFLAQASSNDTKKQIVDATGYQDSKNLEKLLKKMQGEVKRELKIGNAFFVNSLQNKR